MNLSSVTKHILFASVSVTCLLSSLYLDRSDMYAFHLLIILSILTIITPLGAGLYLYKGKFAMLALVLACLGMITALIFAVDGVATKTTFKQACESIGSNREFVPTGDGFYCGGPSEQDYFHSYSFSTPIQDVAFWVYLSMALFSVGSIVYLPVALVRKHLKINLKL